MVTLYGASFLVLFVAESAQWLYRKQLTNGPRQAQEIMGEKLSSQSKHLHVVHCLLDFTYQPRSNGFAAINIIMHGIPVAP